MLGISLNLSKSEYMAQKFVIIVVNPIAGDIDKGELVADVEAHALTLGLQTIVYETCGINDGKHIRHLYEQYQPQRIIIAGGDGTIKEVAAALEDVDVLFGILPAGSANGLSVDLDIPATLDLAIPAAFSTKFIDIDMIKINGHTSLHLSDVGLNAMLVKNYESGTTRGMLGYAKQVLATFKEQTGPFRAHIELEGKEVITEAKMVVVANSQKYGTGVVINPFGKMDDGQFEIVVLRNLDFAVLTKILTGNIRLDTEDVDIYSTKNARIFIDPPTEFQVDGEYIGLVSELNISILASNMKIAVPDYN